MILYAVAGGTTSNRPKRFPITDAHAIQRRRAVWTRAPDVSVLAADQPVWDQPTHAPAKPWLLLSAGSE
jgi:hypothetical protein